MRTFRHYSEVSDLGPTVAAIGNFDGVHLGHQALLDGAISLAQRLDARAVVLTFDPHPMQVVSPERKVQPLTSLSDRFALLESHGVHAVLAQRFDQAFARLTPQAFIDLTLREALGVVGVVVGYNFGFGARRAGTVETLNEAGRDSGFEVRIVEPITDVSGGSISSSAIRRAVGHGDLAKAAEQLGRPHFMTGVVSQGAQRGRTLGFPTANLRLEVSALPPAGVYAGWFDDGEAVYPAVANLGRNPTFGPDNVQCLEVHALSAQLPELYGRRTRFYFVEHLRPEARFNGVDALVAQIQTDSEAAAKVLARQAPPLRFPLR